MGIPIKVSRFEREKNIPTKIIEQMAQVQI